MATGTANPAGEQKKSADKVIEKQLARVRRHIRITDFIGSVMTLLAGMLAFLLGMAIVDHWLVGLGFWLRAMAMMVLITAPAWYLITRILPPLIRGINPAYAAQTIERSEPGLKNSLLNYLLLRRERQGIHDVVFNALQNRAATDISHVAVDQAVDQSALIKAGYILVTVMILGAAYKILSPKDPVQTIQRIILPWAEIDRPARVEITAIEPGDTKVFSGQFLEISALVRNVKPGEPVEVVYSTDDGQLVNQHVAMAIDSAGVRHLVKLPQDERGMRQSLTYSITAGDARSRTFHVEVVSAPTIHIEAVEYDYPAYTKRPREVVKEQGDIQALEGTRVTLRAKTNQPIKTATLELNPASAARNGTPVNSASPAERFALEFRELQAWRQFLLELRDDGQTPRHTSYQLTFTNTEGWPSVDAIVHRIDVIADLAPEVEIITPAKERIEVPLSGMQKIEVRSLDPDYALARLALTAQKDGKEILTESLLKEADPGTGQVMTSYEFRPKDLGLKPGDEVRYRATAEDNRTAAGTSTPQPNVTRTSEYELVVVADPPPQAGDPDKRPMDEPQQDQAQAPDKNAKGAPKGRQEKPPSERPDEPQKPEPSEDGQAKPEDGQQQPGGEDMGQGQEGGGQGQQAVSQPQSGGGQAGGSSNINPPESRQAPGEGAEGQQQGGGTGQQSSEGAQGTSPGDAASDTPGQYHEGGSGQRTEPLHDGEVFEKALRKMEEKRQRSQGGATGEAGGQGREGDRSQTADAASSDDSSSSASTDNESPSGTPQSKRKSQPATKPDSGKKGNSPDKAGTASKEKPSEKAEAGEKAQSEKAEPGEATADAASENGSEKSMTPDTPAGQPDAKQGDPGEDSKEKHGDSSAKKESSGERQGNEKQGKGEQSGEAQPPTAGSSQERPTSRQVQQVDSKGKAEPSGKEGSRKPGQGTDPKSSPGQKSNTPKNAGSSQEDLRKQGNEQKQEDDPADANPDQTESESAKTDSPRESEAKGNQSGDKSGRGKSGPGQGSKQAGNDGAGQTSPADEGAGKAPQPGQGDDGTKGGGKKESPKPTGTPSNSPTFGSSGSQFGDGPEIQPGTEGNEKTPDGQDPPESKNSDGEGQNSGSANPNGGGLPGDGQSKGQSKNQVVPPGDSANLEYTRKTTDMVLEYLKDQQDNPDERLLDELGWTRDDLKAFLDRWQQMKDSAVEDPSMRRELDESLKGLGLRPQRDTKRAARSRSDDNRGLRESGSNSKPPTSYEDQYRAFKKGAARGASRSGGSG